MRNLEMSYYNIYYYCNIADNLLTYFNGYIDWAPTGAQFTEPFFSEEPTNFPKYSALHAFCEFVIGRIIHEDTLKELEEIQTEYDNLESVSDKRERLIRAFNYDKRFHNNAKLEVDRLFDYFNVNHQYFFDYLLANDFSYIEDAYDDFIEFDSDIDEIVLRLSREMFYVLFQNREFLLRFNLYLSNANSFCIDRCTIPQWVKRAVMYRDRGRCINCGKDLSGQFDVADKQSMHFDHIVSLHDGGINDVSNIQLLCQHCNTSKNASSFTSNTYKDWYDFD